MCVFIHSSVSSVYCVWFSMCVYFQIVLCVCVCVCVCECVMDSKCHGDYLDRRVPKGVCFPSVIGGRCVCLMNSECLEDYCWWECASEHAQ